MKQTMSSCVFAGLALSLLAACGGGGGGAADMTRDPVIPGPATPDSTDPSDTSDTPDTPGTPAPAVPATTEDMRGAASDLLNLYAPGGVAEYSSLGVVPVSGSASYGGYLYGDLSTDGGAATDSLIGRLTLEAAFSDSGVDFSGAATGFVDLRDAPLSGTLTVSGGDFNRSGNSASDATLRGVTVAGTLIEGDGTTLDVGVQLEGDFLGDTAQAVGGEAIGRITTGGVSQDFDGGFIAQD